MSAPTRVLWIVNIVLPAVATELGLSKTPFGGWLTLMTDRLARWLRFWPTLCRTCCTPKGRRWPIRGGS